MPKYIKTINFDLDTKSLQEQYPNSNWHKAYEDIKDFLKSKDFSHRQGSGYISNKELSENKVSKILREMSQELNWLNGCVKEIDVADLASKRFSYKSLFKNKRTDSRKSFKERSNTDDKSYNEDDELDLTEQSQSRGR
ncbi:MAG: hypothetical protein J5956_09975 [Ruminococcus sp.]|nr:hypothetical protein [Ruminococcus sp.]